MIDIESLKRYYEEDKIIISIHAQERLRQRGIRQKDIRKAVLSGEIIEQYPDDFPFPSCLILGYDENKKAIHVVISDEGSMGRIITAYIPNTEKFENDFKTRKGREI